MTTEANTQGGIETGGISPFDPEAFMAGLQGQLTPEREQIVGDLVQRPWFQASAPELQSELALLPQFTPENPKENHDGFLADLAGRPDEIGGVTVERMVSLPRGNFALTPMFEVRNPAGTTYTYEYVSWRYGPLSGAKGVVFIRPSREEEPTHLIVLAGEKFAPAAKVYDSIGGFIDLGVEGVQSVTDRAVVETKQELGVEDLQVTDVVNLGPLQIDAGMTNNRPDLFAASITSSEADRIPSDPINPDVTELKSGAVIVPMSQLPELIRNNTDSFFSAAILKTLASTEVDNPTRNAIHKALAVGTVALSEIQITQEVRQLSRSRAQIARRAGHLALSILALPVTYPLALAKDVNHVSKIVRQERSDQGRPYTRGTGVMRSFPQAAGRLVRQGFIDLGELSRFQPTRPPRRQI